MKTSTIIWIVVAALLITGGIITYLIFGRSTPVGTQVTGTQTNDDFDGDGVPNAFDYFPYNANK